MPYQSIKELPEATTNLPAPAKRIFMNVFNAVDRRLTDEGESEDQREKLAFSAAWKAVKGKYREVEGNRWIAKNLVVAYTWEQTDHGNTD